MNYTGDVNDLQRYEVVDSTGDKVGGVGQVYLSDETGEPTWVTVSTGLFGTKETFVPLNDARIADGVITVPYEKSFIKDAPRVDEDGSISVEEENELYRYYNLGDQATGTAGREGVADGRRDGVDATMAGAGFAGGEERRTDREDLAGDRRDEHAQDRLRDQDGEGMTLHEERVDVGTERVETGRARLRKHVVTETKNVEVPVTREEVVLEREPVAEGEGHGGRLGDDEQVVTVSEERPVVEKETVATERVNLGTREVRDTEQVRTEVGHEEVQVDGVEGDARRDDLR